VPTLTGSARLRQLILAAVVVIFLAACFVGPRDSGEPGQGSPSAATSAPRQTAPGKQEDGTMTVEEFQQDLQGAVSVAEDYWTEQFKASGEQFQPIRRVIPYRRNGEVACGREAVPRNNALYCSAGDFIAYDVNWAVREFRDIGDAFLFYLLGHEYAHAVQMRLGIQYEYTIQQELQADCMAGAYIGDSVRSKALTLDDGDIDELKNGLLSVGDDPDQPWFAPGSHGTAQQRTKSFFSGYEKSLAACDL
jgi:predicted metalloprotease